MADALPPETAKQQIESLKAFTADLELSVRKVAKGYGTRPVQVSELKKWLDDALVSNTDAAIRPREGMTNAPYLTGNVNRDVLSKLLTQVKARVTELESGKVEPKEPVKQWLVTQLSDAAASKVMVPGMKGGDTRPASAEEVKGWLGGKSWVDEGGY
ncbi:MAG: hypothetical protein QM817_34105 [Archangium sp.]